MLKTLAKLIRFQRKLTTPVVVVFCLFSAVLGSVHQGLHANHPDRFSLVSLDMRSSATDSESTRGVEFDKIHTQALLSSSPTRGVSEVDCWVCLHVGSHFSILSSDLLWVAAAPSVAKILLTEVDRLPCLFLLPPSRGPPSRLIS